MTKDEIKKALEFCDRDDYFFCGGCAYDNVRNCHDKLQADALNLIIEQEKEIERLKAEFKQLETNAEILARGVRDLNHENYELTEQVKQAKIDVLNEANEKINVISRKFGDCGITAMFKCSCAIDELIREVQNAEDKS